MDKQLMFNDLNKIIFDLSKRSPTLLEKWKEVGYELGLSSEAIHDIGQGYRTSRQCFFAILNSCIRRKGFRENIPEHRLITLRVLIKALRSKEVNESLLADEITKMREEKPLTTKSQIEPSSMKSREPNMKHKPITDSPEPKLDKYLRMYYLRGSMKSLRGFKEKVDDDEWPPSFNVKYVNLTLVKHSKIPYNQTKARPNIEMQKKGQIDDVKGRDLKLENMDFDGRVCLINGAPGVGKTRLALKLSKDWADERLLKNFDLVLYVPLRHPVARLSENLDDLMKYFGEDNFNKGDIELIIKEEGKGVLFIFDGWDELRPSCRDPSCFFPKLIAGDILPGCSIIVTSRPGQSVDIQIHADHIVEVLGFGTKQIEEYIQEYFSDDQDGMKLVENLQNYPSVASTCYVAINLAIVCHVYHCLNYSLPQTLTEVYKWFIIHTILRYLNKKRVAEEIAESVPEVSCTDDVFTSNKFNEAVWNIFKVSIIDTLKQLGNLALNGLKNDDLCFGRSELVNTCQLRNDDYEFDGFGLLKPVHISHVTRLEPYYHFLHLSIQEFIAAFHISELDQQMRWLKDDFRFDATIKFFCGINRFKSQPLRIFLKNANLRLFHLECVYEGQWKDGCKNIASKLLCKYILDNSNGTLQPQQWEVLGYVMSNSEAQWHFKFYRLFLEAKNLEFFRRHLSKRSLSHLLLEQVHMNNDAMPLFSKICQSQEMLKELTIRNCDFSDEHISMLTEIMKDHKGLLNINGRDIVLQGQVQATDMNPQSLTSNIFLHNNGDNTAAPTQKDNQASHKADPMQQDVNLMMSQTDFRQRRVECMTKEPETAATASKYEKSDMSNVRSNSRCTWCICMAAAVFITCILIISMPRSTLLIPKASPSPHSAHLPVHSSASSESKCTEIKSDLELEKVLEQLPAQVSNKKMCRYLGIKGCNQLERSGTLEPGRIAEEYCHQKINPCWEDIIRHLCEDFFDNRLAKTVADSHGSIPYSKYCK